MGNILGEDCMYSTERTIFQKRKEILEIKMQETRNDWLFRKGAMSRQLEKITMYFFVQGAKINVDNN